MFRRARPGAPEGNVGGCGRAGEAQLHVIGAEEAFRALPGGGAPDARWGFLRKLRDLGRQAAGRWLDENLAAVGVPPTLDLARFAGRSWSCVPRTAARPEPPSGGPQEDDLAWRAAPGVI